MMTRAEVERADVLPLLGEVATLRTRDVVARGLCVSTFTHTPTETARTVLDGRGASRVPIVTSFDAVPPVRTGGDVILIPVPKGNATRDVTETPVTLCRQRAAAERTDHAGQAANEEDQP